jgi:drug/metabolite transporter (DMT)-like permease
VGPDSAVLYIALVGIVVVAVLFSLEVRRWKHMGPLMSPRQRVLRVTVIVLIELMFVMILIGPWVVHKRHPLDQLLYWSACLFMGLAVVILAYVDLRAVAKGYAALNRRMLGELREDDRGKDD